MENSILGTKTGNANDEAAYNNENKVDVLDERQEELSSFWNDKRFASDKAIAGKLLADGQNYATQQDFADIDNWAKESMSIDNSNYWRNNYERYGKTMARFQGCFDPAMIKEEEWVDENGEPCKKYTTRGWGYKTLIVGKNKPVEPTDKTKVDIPNVQNQMRQIPSTNAKPAEVLKKNAENTAINSQTDNEAPSLQNQIQTGSLQNSSIAKQHFRQEKLIKMPDHPKDVDIHKNIIIAYKLRKNNSIVKHRDFIYKVREEGEWDYKHTKGKQYQDFGNFNYGATGAAAGFDEEYLLRTAGFVQQTFGDRKSGKDNFFGKPPYGDDPRDQKQIKAGIDWYKQNYGETK